MVRTMSPGPTRHRAVHDALAQQISSGELKPGDRLPSERTLQERFGCARSVVRQALAALVRDGLVMPAYPHGNYVIGTRISWLSRLRLLSSDQWKVTLEEALLTTAAKRVAQALEIAEQAAVIERSSELRSIGGEPWGLGVVRYPILSLGHETAERLLDPRELTYDDLEVIFGQRIMSYHECIRARRARASERRALGIVAGAPVIEVERTALTTRAPMSFFTFVGRADRFEADYLIQA